MTVERQNVHLVNVSAHPAQSIVALPVLNTVPDLALGNIPSVAVQTAYSFGTGPAELPQMAARFQQLPTLAAVILYGALLHPFVPKTYR